jgi:transcriptional regulator with XRE-family HTH domain
MRLDSSARDVVGTAIRDLRLLVGLTQKGLGAQVGQTQGWVSRIENGRIEDVTLETAERLLGVMGARLVVAVDAPFLGDRRRQREPAHSRMSAHVVRHLRRQGWQVTVEVEVGSDRSRGWIDILAYHTETRILLVIELKTEIVDMGGIQRSFSWYGREAWQAAKRSGWRPERAFGCLLLLATEANDDRARANRDVMDLEFQGRAANLTRLVAGERLDVVPKRFVAMVDPASRRRAWLRPLRIDGRRAGTPYRDYADFMRSTRLGKPPR